MNSTLSTFDRTLISFSGRVQGPAIRLSLFIIYFWFGMLKVAGVSPANPLVADLLHTTLPFLSFDSFIVWFGVFEAIIGILFLIPKFTRLTILLFAIHMIMTCGVLVMLPAVAWDSAFVPSLEGQYVIKNIALIALVITLVSRLQPMKQK